MNDCTVRQRSRYKNKKRMYSIKWSTYQSLLPTSYTHRKCYKLTLTLTHLLAHPSHTWQNNTLWQHKILFLKSLMVFLFWSLPTVIVRLSLFFFSFSFSFWFSFLLRFFPSFSCWIFLPLFSFYILPFTSCECFSHSFFIHLPCV